MAARMQGVLIAFRNEAPHCAAARRPPRCLACLAPTLRTTTTCYNSSDVLTASFLSVVVSRPRFGQHRVQAPEPQKKHLDFFGNQIEGPTVGM